MERMYDDAKRLLEKEVTEITQKGELSPSSLDVMDKAIDILKDIETICAMKEEYGDYSERMPYMYDDMSYARGRGRYAKRDSMGRYASYDGSYDGSYDAYGRYNRGYSRDDDYERMMREAQTEKERDLIRQLIDAKKH